MVVMYPISPIRVHDMVVMYPISPIRVHDMVVMTRFYSLLFSYRFYYFSVKAYRCTCVSV